MPSLSLASPSWTYFFRSLTNAKEKHRHPSPVDCTITGFLVFPLVETIVGLAVPKPISVMLLYKTLTKGGRHAPLLGTFSLMTRDKHSLFTPVSVK